ncbi:hypothetical protein PMAC_000539 [Pneumocystis sp. 'macacae']|nr:hypothetical protein PMAC_000539 [Pneumocystis sp. 'macacae']
MAEFKNNFEANMQRVDQELEQSAGGRKTGSPDQMIRKEGVYQKWDNAKRGFWRQTGGVDGQGFNLFVTGIASKLGEEELREMFSVYGEVEKCQIMVDPHTKEPRGFGFVQMSTIESANAAREGLTGEERYGRILRNANTGKILWTAKKRNNTFPRTPYDRYTRYERYDRYDRFDEYDRYNRYDRRLQERFHPYYEERDSRSSRSMRPGRYEEYYTPGRGYGYYKEDQYFRDYYKRDR